MIEQKKRWPFSASLTCLLVSGCGSSVVSEVQVGVSILVDGGLEDNEVDVDGGVEVESHTATSGPAEKSINETEVEPLRFVMKGVELKGPFKSPAKACKWLNDNSIGKCVAKKNGWNNGKVLGERGGLLSAKPIRVKLHREKGRSFEEACGILIRTSKGWWLHGHREACFADEEFADDPFYTDLGQFTYADDLSFGVLLVGRSGQRLAKRTETRDGKEVVSEWWVDQNELMYCAVSDDGVPRCSKWHVTGCHFNERYVEHKGGEIVVSEGQPDRAMCAERMMKPGIYTIFEEGFHKTEGMLVQDDSFEEQEPLETIPMFGPFSSIKAYCNSLPYGHDDESGEYEEESTGSATPPPRCVMGKKGWSGVQPNGGKGTIKAARLLRVKSSLAGAPIEYCLVAMKTENGWFFSAETYHCQGVLGPSTNAKIVTRHVKWVGGDEQPVLAIVHDLFLTHTDYGKDCYDYHAAGGSCGRRESYFTDRFAHLRLCGMGSSGIPSCSGAISLGCPGSHGKKVYNAWSYSEKGFELTGSDELREGCDLYSELDPGPHQISFL